MKKTFFVLLVLISVLSFIFLSGCAARATVSGGPTISVPPPPTGGKTGILGKIFSPNNAGVYVNSTEFIVVLNTFRTPFGRNERRVLPGQITYLPWPNYHGTGKVVVIASVYDPITGMFLGAGSEQFSLTDDGGHPRMFNRVIRSRSSMGRQVIYFSNR